ncbi:MAG TPA: lipocalin-like domain-containing protein [Candidatus Dormibacteraeota bacterium]|nr:lipocalin-like domain-containing protein [Candidatus Dormibacteraeota bacterium]
MRIAVPLCLVLAALGLPAQTATAPTPDATNIREKLIGSWRLVSRDEQFADGKMQTRTDAVGVIMYTADGHMAVQIMLPEKSEAPDNPVRYQQAGYEAYQGTYTIDEKAHTVTHHVESALVRSLIGKDLTRVYRFEGKQLILKSSRADEHWAIIWEHN